MGAEIDIYYLYQNNKESYLLLCVQRDNFSNTDEGSYYNACAKIDEKISKFISGKSLKLIGSMEYLPVGEDIYSAKEGDILDIFYCHNFVDKKYLIIGTGKNESTFLTEALEDYGNEVDSNTINHVKVIFHKIET